MRELLFAVNIIIYVYEWTLTLWRNDQTGSGKTYSMLGGTPAATQTESHGIIPRVCELLFARIAQLTATRRHWKAEVQVSYVEIYNECCYDLLEPFEEVKSTLHRKKVLRKLRVREHTSKVGLYGGVRVCAASLDLAAWPVCVRGKLWTAYHCGEKEPHH